MLSEIRKSLKKPYWAAEKEDSLPGWDFCREIVAAGDNEKFPDGALGLRVDDDFWSVAVLPSEYLEWSLEDIVKDLWPHCWKATFHPDSGSIEQKVEFLERRVYNLGVENKGLYSSIRKLEKELRRCYPAGRAALKEEQ